MTDLENVDAGELRRLLVQARETVDELAADNHALRCELVRLRSVREAEARRNHPSTRTDDQCNPHGIVRPFTVIRGGAA